MYAPHINWAKTTWAHCLIRPTYGPCARARRPSQTRDSPRAGRRKSPPIRSRLPAPTGAHISSVIRRRRLHGRGCGNVPERPSYSLRRLSHPCAPPRVGDDRGTRRAFCFRVPWIRGTARAGCPGTFFRPSAARFWMAVSPCGRERRPTSDHQRRRTTAAEYHESYR
jgi:hypothetical protein